MQKEAQEPKLISKKLMISMGKTLLSSWILISTRNGSLMVKKQISGSKHNLELGVAMSILATKNEAMFYT